MLMICLMFQAALPKSSFFGEHIEEKNSCQLKQPKILTCSLFLIAAKI